MGKPGCDPCCGIINTAQSVESSRWAVISLMCEILAAVEAGGGGGGGGGVSNVTGINGVAPSVGNGTTDAGTQRVTLSSDSTGQTKLAAGTAAIGSLTAGTALIGKVGIDQTTPGTTNGVVINSGAVTATVTGAVTATLAAGSAIAGKVGIDQTTPGTTNLVAAGLVAGTALVGKVGIDQTTLGTTNGVSGVAATTGGYTNTRVSGGLGTTVTAIKSSAQGKLGGWVLFNPNSTNAFVQIFNVATAGAVTLGTTAPTLVIGLPPFGGANLINDTGIDFSAGIQVAATASEAGLTSLVTLITANFLFK